MTNAADVDEVLKAAGLPILGVAIHATDRSLWRVDWAPGVSQAQRDQAAAIIAAYVDPTPAAILDKKAQAELGEKKLQACVMGLWECIPAPTLTKAQLKNRILAIYKTL